MSEIVYPVGAVSLQQLVIAAAQQRLDNFARTRNYDSILSACTYATSTNPKFSAEGSYCVSLRDATWAKLYQILADVELGKRLPPNNVEEVMAELPQPTWPATVK
jgi:hypothetical protein